MVSLNLLNFSLPDLPSQCIHEGSCKPPFNVVLMSKSFPISGFSSPISSVTPPAQSTRKDHGPTPAPTPGPSPITPSALARHGGAKLEGAKRTIDADTSAASSMVRGFAYSLISSRRPFGVFRNASEPERRSGFRNAILTHNTMLLRLRKYC